MRHKRHEEAPAPPRDPRRVVVLMVLLAVVGLGVGLGWYWLFRPRKAVRILEEAGRVQSAIAQEGDSLQVIVRWALVTPDKAQHAESLRVEVQIDSMGIAASRVRMLGAQRREDTLYVPAPDPGATTSGLSCVAAQHHSRISRESCTPWQYVRPMASAPGVRRQDGAPEPGKPVRIVVHPDGIQVDPDIGGRCAAWQQRHPDRTVWIDVNRIAVPPCTGPNNRPTVAQFCAFAELADGRRVKTANTANSEYCDELFRAWERQRQT